MSNERRAFSKGYFIKKVANKHKKLAKYLGVDKNIMKKALRQAKASDSLESIFNNSNSNARKDFLDAVVGTTNQAKRQEVGNKLDEIWGSAEKAALEFDENHSNGLVKSSNPKTDWFVFLFLLFIDRKFDKLVKKALKDNNGPSLLSFSSPTPTPAPGGAPTPTPTPNSSATPGPAPTPTPATQGGASAVNEGTISAHAAEAASRVANHNSTSRNASELENQQYPQPNEDKTLN